MTLAESVTDTPGVTEMTCAVEPIAPLALCTDTYIPTWMPVVVENGMTACPLVADPLVVYSAGKSPLTEGCPVTSIQVHVASVVLAPLVTVQDGSDEPLTPVVGTSCAKTRSLPTAGVASWRTSDPAG